MSTSPRSWTRSTRPRRSRRCARAWSRPPGRARPGRPFANYPITVASKTGTPERGDGLYNSVFIAYAPAEDPEIAVAVVVEKGWEGYQIAPVARDVFDAYFFSRTGGSSTNYGELLP